MLFCQSQSPPRLIQVMLRLHKHSSLNTGQPQVRFQILRQIVATNRPMSLSRQPTVIKRQIQSPEMLVRINDHESPSSLDSSRHASFRQTFRLSCFSVQMPVQVQSKFTGFVGHIPEDFGPLERQTSGVRLPATVPGDWSQSSEINPCTP
jgi:hypothetical protein